MAVWRVTVEKFYPTAQEYWTNVYHVNAADMDAADTAADAIVQAERAITDNRVTITKSRVDDGLPNTAVWSTRIYNQLGTLDLNGADLMPLFVVARVDLEVQGGGRPSRKYLRATFSEGEATATTIHPVVQGRLANYAAALAAAGACDPQGQAVITGSPWPMPAMRQLRRGSKKRRIL